MKAISTTINQEKLSSINLSAKNNSSLFSNAERNTCIDNKLHYLSDEGNIEKIQRVHLTVPSTFDRASIKYKPTSTLSSNYSPPQSWQLNFDSRELHNTISRIKLTAIELLLIKTLAIKNDRICSKQELISGIGKDPYSYSGLEMSLSRLQHKFKATFNERLFRSVRNRGYCLVQDVMIEK